MTWDGVFDVLSAVCLLAGAFLSFAAGVGVLRFPDLLARMHAATKPQVLGLILVLLGLELRLRTWDVLLVVVLVTLFQMLTAPVSAHMVGRAGYRTGKVRTDLLVLDELTSDLDEARTLAHEHDLARIATERAEHAGDDVAPAVRVEGVEAAPTDDAAAAPVGDAPGTAAVQSAGGVEHARDDAPTGTDNGAPQDNPGSEREVTRGG